MRVPPALFVLTVLFACIASTTVAKTAEELQRIEEQMSQKQQQQQVLDTAAREAAKSLGDLRDRLIHSTQALQDKETEEETLEDKLDDLTEEITEKSKNATEERARLSLMVSALVEIASRPPETLFLQKGTATDHLHRSLLLHSVLPGLKDQAESTARDLAALYDLQTQLAEQKRLVAAAQQNMTQQRGDLDQLIAARQGFLQRTEQQKADITKHLEALSSEAQDLRQLMEKVSTPQPRRAPKSLPGNAVALKWPVSGTVKKHFGDHDSDGVTSEGLTLSAPSGAPVIAPRAGRVVFVGPFRGYGQIMILQHDGGYHSFLAGFGRIDAEMGQDVVAGEPLGVLPVKPGARPDLYFEWRHGDEPVDPIVGLGGGLGNPGGGKRI
jgi:septal ring factor EnvC (AmiA/AmiB activator)